MKLMRWRPRIRNGRWSLVATAVHSGVSPMHMDGKCRGTETADAPIPMTVHQHLQDCHGVSPQREASTQGVHIRLLLSQGYIRTSYT